MSVFTSERVCLHRLCCSEPVHQRALHSEEQCPESLEASDGQAYPPMGGAARPPSRDSSKLHPECSSVAGET